MTSYQKNAGSLGLVGWLVIAGIGGAAIGAWKLYQKKMVGEGNAKIECSLRLEASQADCYATFLRYPAGDPTDVRVELSGPTLVSPVQVEWAALAPQDKREGPALSATDPPPLGRQLRWRMPIALVPKLTPEIGDFIVRAKLFWAGRQQDFARFSTKVVYNPEP